MKKTIIRSTFVLIIVSLIAKTLSFLVRIILARTLSNDAMNYYTLATPTMVFVITLAQMGIPAALSKVIAQSKYPLKSLKTSIVLSIINNICIGVGFIFILPLLSKYVLKQEDLTPVLYAILPLIPCVSISGLLKGYLYGIQHHVQATSCQLFEEISRILFLFVIFTLYPNLNNIDMAKIAMYSISIGEFVSSIYMLFAMHLKRKQLLRIPFLFANLQRQQFDDVLRICLPMTGSRFLGSITYFLEPIVMVIGITTLQSHTMIQAYGQLNGYVLPILTMPSFITVTLANVLLPSFTFHFTRGNLKHAMKLFNAILGCCFFIGLVCSFCCYMYSEELLQLFYRNNRGAFDLKILAWPFAFYTLQAPLSSMLHALSYSKKTVVDTALGSLVRILCILFLTPFIFQHSLVIALTLGMLVTTLTHAIRLYFALKKANLSSFSLPHVPS